MKLLFNNSLFHIKTIYLKRLFIITKYFLSNKNKVNDYLYKFIKNKEKGKYLIHKDELDNKEKIYLKSE